VATGVAGCVLGFAALVFTQQDFAAARSTYRAGERLLAGDFEEAIDLCNAARSRLNPQRALTNLARLAEAHLRVAQSLQQRAFERQTRAQAADLPDEHLLELAELDYEASNNQCLEGSAALKELVSWSPSYFNHGWLEGLLELTLARTADARGDISMRDQLLRAATAALERELVRQPFNSAIAVDFAQVAAPILDYARITEVLARPLRHQGIDKDYVDLLGRLHADPDFGNQFGPLVQQAKVTLTSPPADSTEEGGEGWAPEKLRLGATVYFMRGQYDRARENLELAAKAYDGLAAEAPMGAASCYAELADCRFFDDPSDPGPAIACASRAIALAPESLTGRQLRENVARRNVDYHLASDEEEMGLRLVRELDPAAPDEAVMRMLGLRYRRLCESLLQRREAGLLRKPPKEMLPKLLRWVVRAIELRPDDALAHYLAADLTLYAGDDNSAAMHLQKAVEFGLAPESAVRFLLMALEEAPDSAALTTLLGLLRGEQAPDAADVAGPPPAGERIPPEADNQR
jgi:tetratricopeptide (TPR) repeat protein